MTIECFQRDGCRRAQWVLAICFFRCIPRSERMCFWMGTRSPGTWMERLGFCLAPLPRQEHSMGVWLWLCQVLSCLRVLIKTTRRQHLRGKESTVSSTRRIEQEGSTGKKKKKKLFVLHSTALHLIHSHTSAWQPVVDWFREAQWRGLQDCRRLTVLPTVILSFTYHMDYIRVRPSCLPQLFWWVSA